MGYSSWSADSYKERSAFRSKTGTPTFNHTDSIYKGTVEASTHESLDPSKLKAGKRESRDSSEHPNTNPVAIGLDVTGSMRSVPGQMQQELLKLMSLLLVKGYLEDPAILVAGIGDVKFDKAPLQIGQFESDISIETDITNLYLEGGGGGNMHESYELFLYFLARHTSCDSFEKRNKKGYAFIICDEELADEVSYTEIRKVFGDSTGDQVSNNIPIKQIVDEVLEKWELYCIIPNMTCHYEDERYSRRWKELLGERVLKLEDPKGICDLVATTIGVLEDNLDIDDVISDLVSEGVSESTATSVSNSLATVAKNSSGKIATIGTGLGTL